MNLRQTGTLCLALALLGQMPAWASAPALPHPAPTEPSAITTSAEGADTADDYFRVIAGLADASDVQLYRIAARDDRDVAASASRLVRQLKLASSGEGGLGVLYPDIGEPYRTVFAKIIEGIEDKTRMRVTSIPIGAEQSVQELVGELRRQDIRVVIALGRHGMKAAAGLDRDIGVVLGGVVSIPDGEARNMSVCSLAPDPTLLFERLKNLMPGARRVFVIYDPRQNAWLIRLAREAARSHGLELVALEAPDLKGAMRFYQEVMATADARRDSLWLPQDSVTVEESAVLPLVLQEAWNRNLAVFSSSVGHVKRGALFSLYPNNVEMGRNLASLALGQLSGAGQPARVMPLRDVLVAVNTRTASHLGLDLRYAQPQGFDMVFPDQ